MQCNVGFSQAKDGSLLVTTEFVNPLLDGAFTRFACAAFADENVFLSNVIFADFDEEDTVCLIANVLLALSDRPQRSQWVTIHLTGAQLLALGLEIPGPKQSRRDLDDIVQYKEVLMQAPIPLNMLSGPDHVFTFMNQAYVQMVGKETADSLLGKPLRVAKPELQRQPFLDLLDQVYRTGIPYRGVEAPAKLYSKTLKKMQSFFFDFVYQPIRGLDGSVCAILCQAIDVTERVLEKQVRESREAQLYKQWAELEAIYRNSPVGMCLIDSETHSILRINEIKAKLLGSTIESLIGKRPFDLAPALIAFKSIYERVAAGESIENYEFRADLPGKPGYLRTWLVNFSPCYDGSGRVEAIASISLEVTDRPMSTVN